MSHQAVLGASPPDNGRIKKPDKPGKPDLVCEKPQDEQCLKNICDLDNDNCPEPQGQCLIKVCNLGGNSCPIVSTYPEKCQDPYCLKWCKGLNIKGLDINMCAAEYCFMCGPRRAPSQPQDQSSLEFQILCQRSSGTKCYKRMEAGGLGGCVIYTVSASASFSLPSRRNSQII
jgi:hypothetical protein